MIQVRSHHGMMMMKSGAGYGEKDDVLRTKNNINLSSDSDEKIDLPWKKQHVQWNHITLPPVLLMNHHHHHQHHHQEYNQDDIEQSEHEVNMRLLKSNKGSRNDFFHQWRSMFQGQELQQQKTDFNGHSKDYFWEFDETITVTDDSMVQSSSNQQQKHTFANWRDITLQEVSEIELNETELNSARWNISVNRTEVELMNDEDVFQTTDFDMSHLLLTEEDGLWGAATSDGNGGHDAEINSNNGDAMIGFSEDETANNDPQHHAQQEELEQDYDVIGQKRGQKRSIQQLIIDDEVCISNETMRAQLEDASAITLSRHRPHLCSSGDDHGSNEPNTTSTDRCNNANKSRSALLLKHLQMNPMSFGLHSSMIQFYQARAQWVTSNDHKRRRLEEKRSDEIVTGRVNENDRIQQRNEEFGGDDHVSGLHALGFDEEFEPADPLRGPASVMRTPLKNRRHRQLLTPIDNNELTAILMFDDHQLVTQTPQKQQNSLVSGSPSSLDLAMNNTSIQSSISYDSNHSGASPSAKTANMQRKTWKMLEYCRSKMNDNQEQYTFKDIAKTRDPTLASLCFYHILVLATNDFIKVRQDEPYGNITIQSSTNFQKNY